MLKLWSRLKQGLSGSTRPERIDAKRIYAKLMKQSRNSDFYTPSLIADDTDGRMEWLSAHLAVVMHALGKFGDDGATLSQAIYDVMVDDFDIALREEGLSDSGVKHRIKPLAKMFLTRARTYAAALESGEPDLATVLSTHIIQSEEAGDGDELVKYTQNYAKNLSALTLDEIAQADFEFPDF